MPANQNRALTKRNTGIRRNIKTPANAVLPTGQDKISNDDGAANRSHQIPINPLAISGAERKLFAKLFGNLIDQILAEP